MAVASDQGPICILRPSKDHGSLEVEPAGMAAVEALGEVTVVAIAGNQRGGKSTLMNLLHGRSLSGFQMGHYLDPKTSGVWVWPRPHPWQEGVTMLLLDSEGLDSPHVPHHYNWLLSAITLLASDVFMYQSRGSIEQSQGERLDMILRIAAQLSRTSSEKELPESPTASFLWLLRDHQLRMRRSPRQELLEKLDPAALQTLGRCFSTSDCVLLPRPVQSDEDMQRLDELGYENLSAEFREEFVVLERRLFELLAKPRTVLGGALTGTTLVSCLRSFVDVTHAKGGFIEDICSLPSQRELLMKVAGERAIQAGLGAYRQAMASAGVGSNKCGSTLLLEAHVQGLQAADSAFAAEAAAIGLLPGERSSFEALLMLKIAEWGPDAPSPELPGSDAVDKAAASMISGKFPSAAFPAVAVPGLCRRGGVLKGGLLHEIWQKHAQASADASTRATVELLGSFHQRLEVTCGAASGDGAHPFGKVEEVWMELQKVHHAMLPDSTQQMGMSSSVAALSFSGAAAGDRVTLSLAQRDAATREQAIHKRVHEVRDQLQSEAKVQLDSLEASVSRHAAEQTAALTTLEQRQAGTMQEVRAHCEAKAGELQQAVAAVEAGCKATLQSWSTELQAELQEVQDGAASASDKVRTEAEQQLRRVESEFAERLCGQLAELRAAEARLKDAAAGAEQRLREENAGLAKEFREGATQMQESVEVSSGKLRAELRELEERRETAHLEVLQLLHDLEKQQEKCKVDMQGDMEVYNGNLASLRSWTQQQLKESLELSKELAASHQESMSEQHRAFQKERKSDFADYQQELREARKEQQEATDALETSMGDRLSVALKAQGELKQHLNDGEAQCKSGFDKIQQQLEQQVEQQQQPIAALQSAFAEQRSALETLQSELHTLCGAHGESKSGIAEMQQQLGACWSTVATVEQEVRSRLQDLERQHEQLRELDLDGLQQKLKTQQEQLDLAATLCRTAETAAERLAAAVLIGSTFLGCSNMLPFARAIGLYTVAVPILAAGAGLHYGSRGFSLQDAINTLPPSWQLRMQTCWTQVEQRGLQPLTRVTKECWARAAVQVEERVKPKMKEIGLDKHARSCLSAVSNEAGKLRKRFAVDAENTSPSNIEAIAPSPKRARTSLSEMQLPGQLISD